MGLFDKFKVGKEHTFEMRILNTFTINNHGVVVNGVIGKGKICVGDDVIINGKKYNVFMIDAVSDPDTKKITPVDSASEGMNAALHLSTMSIDNIRAGDIATA